MPCHGTATLNKGQGISPDDLVDGYRTGSSSGFWDVFNKNREGIDTVILEKTLELAIFDADNTLVNLVLEGARIKGDQKGLLSMMLAAADHFLSIDLHTEALKLYDASMSLSRSVDDQVMFAKSHEGNGDVAFHTGNTSNAILMYNRAAELYTAAGSASGRGTVARKMADVLFQTGDHSRARTLYDGALAILSQEKNLLEEGNIYRGLGRLSMQRRDYGSSSAFFEIAFERYGRTRYKKGEGDINLALGGAALQKGDVGAAREHYKKAFALYVETRSLTGQGYANQGLGDVDLAMYNDDEALRSYDRAYSLFVIAGHPLGQAGTLVKMGRKEFQTGNIMKAEENYEKTLPLYHQVKEPAGHADALKGLGDIRHYNRNTAEALEMYNRALPYYVHADDPLGQGDVYRVIGDIHSGAGDEARAMDHYEKALSFYIKGSSPMRQAETYRALGAIYLRLDRKDHAMAMLNSAMAIYKRIDEPAGQGVIYNTLGGNYLKNGNRMGAFGMFREALKYLDRARSIVDQGHAYEGIGDVFLSAGDHVNSLENYDKALALYGKMEEKGPGAFVLIKKALIHGHEGNAGLAAALFKEGFDNLERARTQGLSVEIEKTYIEKAAGHYESTAAFLLGDNENERAFHYVQAMKARAFLNQIVNGLGDLKKGIDESLMKERDSLEREHFVIGEKLAREYQRTAPDEETIEKLRSDRAFIWQKLGAIREEIRYKNPLYASVRYPVPITVESLQGKLLREDELLAEYFLAHQSAFCLTVSKTGFDVIELPATSDELVMKVKYFIDNIRGHRQGQPFLEGLAEDLYGILVKPLEDHLRDKTLIVAPHGILAHLPFEALRTVHDEKKIFLVEKFPVKYIQSATALAVSRSHSSREGLAAGFAGFGDPVYGPVGPAPKKEETGENDEDLPAINVGPVFMEQNYVRAGGILTSMAGAEAGLEKIAKVFERSGAPARLYLGIDVRKEQAMSAVMERYPFIHFAVRAVAGANFQAIALSHVAGDKEDSFLTLGNIMNSHFNARLAVLSGCDTVPGETARTEGVTGLARALMYAGSSAAAISLWSVNGKGSGELTVRFYEAMLNKKMEKEDALRIAKLRLIDGAVDGGFSHPFYWSTLVMYGE